MSQTKDPPPSPLHWGITKQAHHHLSPPSLRIHKPTRQWPKKRHLEPIQHIHYLTSAHPHPPTTQHDSPSRCALQLNNPIKPRSTTNSIHESTLLHDNTRCKTYPRVSSLLPSKTQATHEDGSEQHTRLPGMEPASFPLAATVYTTLAGERTARNRSSSPGRARGRRPPGGAAGRRAWLRSRDGAGGWFRRR